MADPNAAPVPKLPFKEQVRSMLSSFGLCVDFEIGQGICQADCGYPNRKPEGEGSGTSEIGRTA